MTAGFVMAAVTSPIDVVKTRIMNQKLASQRGEKITGHVYQGSWDCFVRVHISFFFFCLYIISLLLCFSDDEG